MQHRGSSLFRSSRQGLCRHAFALAGSAGKSTPYWYSIAMAACASRWPFCAACRMGIPAERHIGCILFLTKIASRMVAPLFSGFQPASVEQLPENPPCQQEVPGCQHFIQPHLFCMLLTDRVEGLNKKFLPFRAASSNSKSSVSIVSLFIFPQYWQSRRFRSSSG